VQDACQVSKHASMMCRSTAAFVIRRCIQWTSSLPVSFW